MPILRTATVNHWPDTACARAFWGQQELPPYQELLADTAQWLEPQPGQRWLDLGCGCGKLTEAVWNKSGGAVAEVVGLDCASVNARAFAALGEKVQPTPRPGQIRFVQADFSRGLPWPDAYFDGAVSGLAIQYAESFSEEQGRWTTDSYDRLLAEVCRVLRPGGRFVFSVNVPRPSWGRVAVSAFTGVLWVQRPTRYIKRAWRMWRYGRWLKREARRGRFHYLALPDVFDRLARAGFGDMEERRSFVKQAYVIRCQRPG